MVGNLRFALQIRHYDGQMGPPAPPALLVITRPMPHHHAPEQGETSLPRDPAGPGSPPQGFCQPGMPSGHTGRGSNSLTRLLSIVVLTAIFSVNSLSHGQQAATAINPGAALSAAEPASGPTDPTVLDVAEDLDRMVRRLYLATAEEDRPDLIASLLEDPSPYVVRSALDLALRQQTGGRSLGPEAAATVLRLLQHPSNDIRSAAARWADLDASELAADAVFDALAAEQDPAVAQVLLTVASRWPDRLSAPQIIRWIDPAAPMHPAAARALAEMLTGSNDLEPAEASTVLRSLRMTEDAALTPAMCRLMVRIGEPRDEGRLRSMATHSDPVVRRRAAMAMATSRFWRDFILERVNQDSELTEAAAVAAMSLPPQEAVAALLALPALEPDAALAPLADLSARLPTALIVRLAGSAADPSRKIAMLANIEARQTTSLAQAEALVLLAEARMRADQRPAAVRAAQKAVELINARSWAQNSPEARALLDRAATIAPPDADG